MFTSKYSGFMNVSELRFPVVTPGKVKAATNKMIIAFSQKGLPALHESAKSKETIFP